MIYRALWTDGRKMLLRTSDEEQARQRATDWRKNEDPMFDGDVSEKPVSITMVPSRGPVSVLLVGWMPGAEGAENE